MLEYNEQTENLMEIAMMLEQLKGESEYLFEVLTDIDSITWKRTGRADVPESTIRQPRMGN